MLAADGEKTAKKRGCKEIRRDFAEEGESVLTALSVERNTQLNIRS